MDQLTTMAGCATKAFVKEATYSAASGLAKGLFHIITYGCQMNVFDSRRIGSALRSAGYEETPDPALADVILVNTCSVREKPERKVLDTLRRLRPLKEANPSLVIGVCGCVAQQHGQALLECEPCLDLVFGPDQVSDVSALVGAARSGKRVVHVARMPREDYRFVPVDPASEPGPTAFLTVMKGCDKVCSYCIVPFTRGREVSKPPEVVLQEVQGLVAAGVREVTLLGQNVNAYGKDLDLGVDFADLLEMLDKVPGLVRLRFVTSHPADADERMLSCFGRLRTVAPYLHLPLQAGSDKVLALMRRGYTASEYLEKVALARRYCPDIALSSDIIVGFPGETREDFEETLRMIEEVRFDTLYAFKYSPRPHTRAAAMEDTCPASEKARRLLEVQTLQDRIGAERLARFVGREEEVLVEGPSRMARTRGGHVQWMGRTATNHVVNFTARSALEPGQVVKVRVLQALRHSLAGEAL